MFLVVTDAGCYCSSVATLRLQAVTVATLRPPCWSMTFESIDCSNSTEKSLTLYAVLSYVRAK